MSDDHSAAIARDASCGLTSNEIRDEIIRAVGMMASARTPEMTARYDAAIAREHGQTNAWESIARERHTTIEKLQAVLEKIQADRSAATLQAGMRLARLAGILMIGVILFAGTCIVAGALQARNCPVPMERLP